MQCPYTVYCSASPSEFLLQRVAARAVSHRPRRHVVVRRRRRRERHPRALGTVVVVVRGRGQQIPVRVVDATQLRVGKTLRCRVAQRLQVEPLAAPRLQTRPVPVPVPRRIDRALHRQAAEQPKNGFYIQDKHFSIAYRTVVDNITGKKSQSGQKIMQN